jgi:hypothetical protein
VPPGQPLTGSQCEPIGHFKWATDCRCLAFLGRRGVFRGTASTKYGPMSAGKPMTKKPRSYEVGHSPKFMVVIDDSPECDRALYFASRRALRVGATVLVLRVIKTRDRNQQWPGVADIMPGA